jgi:hypothetical protein
MLKATYAGFPTAMLALAGAALALGVPAYFKRLAKW